MPKFLKPRKLFQPRKRLGRIEKDILNHIFSSATEAFSLNRGDGVRVECFSSLLSNESIMVLMHKTVSA